MSHTIQIIANGGAREMIDAETREHFQKLVQKLLPGADVHVTSKGEDVCALVRDAVRRGATVVAAGGGDGTVNAVASVLVGTTTTLGVIPLGTLNHFAKDAGIPLEMEEALTNLRDGMVAHVDVGTVADRIFINNSGLGLYPDMVFNREQRQKEGWSKWPSVVVESARAFRRYRLLRLVVQVDGKKLERRTPAVFIGNNDYSLDETIASTRASITDGTLCLYIPHPESRAGLVWFSLRAFFGSPRAGSDFDKFLATEFVLNSHHDTLRVSIDGEVTTMKTPLTYRVKPAALRVMVPRPTESAEADMPAEPTR